MLGLMNTSRSLSRAPSRGFIGIVLLIIIGLAVIGGGGWYVARQNSPAVAPAVTSEVATTSTPHKDANQPTPKSTLAPVHNPDVDYIEADQTTSINKSGPVSVPPQGPITIQGVMVCLPHKNTTGPQTLDCGYGLKDDTGRYFGLGDADPNYKNIMGVPMNVRVEVTGTFIPKEGSTYQDIGTISVTKIKIL